MEPKLHDATVVYAVDPTAMELEPLPAMSQSINFRKRTLISSFAKVAKDFPSVIWYGTKLCSQRTAKTAQSRVQRLRTKFKQSTVQVFEYERLSQSNSIRLLSIASGSPLSPLVCSLEEFCLEDFPEYSALSYSWGKNTSWKRKIYTTFRTLLPMILCYCCYNSNNADSPVSAQKVRKYHIICNGRSLSITRNLYECLLQLREMKYTGRIWIDAICVNQADIPERNSQVLHMPTVYRSAQHVTAWLGTCPSPLDDPQIMGAIHKPKIGFASEEMHNIVTTARPSTWSRIAILRHFSRVHLFGRRYFQRAWIIQEILLAKEITFFLGKHEFKVEQLIAAADRLDERSRVPIQSAFQVILSLQNASTTGTRTLLEERFEFQKRGAWRLQDYVAAAHGHDATDQRDLVYAGLSLVDPGVMEHAIPANTASISVSLEEYQPRTFQIDYSPEVQIEHVFMQCAARLLQECGLYALSLAYKPSKIIAATALPTWVPHFQGRQKFLPFRSELRANYTAGGDTVPGVRISIAEGVLHLETGADYLGRITEVYKNVDWKAFATVLISQPGFNDTLGLSTLEILARTILADTLEGETPVPLQVIDDLEAHIRSGIANIKSSFANADALVPKKWVEKEAKEKQEKAKQWSDDFDEALTKNTAATMAHKVRLGVPNVTVGKISDMLQVTPSETQITRTSQFIVPSDALKQQRLALTAPDSAPIPISVHTIVDTEKQKDPIPTGLELEHAKKGDQAWMEAVSQLTEEQLEVYFSNNPLLKSIFLRVPKFERNLEQRCRHRCLFVTDTGHIGIGPGDLEEGSSIMVMPGGYVPFAMVASRDLVGEKKFVDMEDPKAEEERARRESTVVYELRGEVYVHGIMYGERLRSADWDPKPIVIA